MNILRIMATMARSGAKAADETLNTVHTVVNPSVTKAAQGVIKSRMAMASKLDHYASVSDTALLPVRKTVGAAAWAVKGTARTAGRVAGFASDHPRTTASIAAGAGIISGMASGIRDSAQMVNKELGNPVGSYSELMTRTAFSGNPSQSRSNNRGATGNLTINSGKR